MANPIYTLSAGSAEELMLQLNLILNSISDRLDAIEGRRGTAQISSDLTITGQLLIKDSEGNEIQGFKDE